MHWPKVPFTCKYKKGIFELVSFLFVMSLHAWPPCPYTCACQLPKKISDYCWGDASYDKDDEDPAPGFKWIKIVPKVYLHVGEWMLNQNLVRPSMKQIEECIFEATREDIQWLSERGCTENKSFSLYLAFAQNCNNTCCTPNNIVVVDKSNPCAKCLSAH